MFRFAHPEILYVLFVIPVILIVYWIAKQTKKRHLKRFGDPEILRSLMPDVSNFRPGLKFILLLLAFAMVLLALAGPQFGTKLQNVKRKGVELIIALDVSNSMLAEDIKPNRLERAKLAIEKLTDRLHNDKIGLIVFAGASYIQIPITSDYSAARLFLSSVNTQIVPRQGTAIGSAIDQAMNSFDPKSDLQKSIIIITDGENHDDDAIAEAKKAADKGIIVNTLGMGLPQGAPIPMPGKYGAKTYRKDKNGNIVISKLDENTLKKIAAAGNGIYVRANNTETGLNRLFDEINKMTRKEYESKTYSEYDEKFQYPLAIALFLLVIEVLILERRNKWLSKFNVFKIKM